MTTISYLALVCYVAVTSLVPGTLKLEKRFSVPKGTAVYLGNTPVVMYVIGPLLSHFTGRRPVLLLSNLIAIVGTIVVASANTYTARTAFSNSLPFLILGLGEERMNNSGL
jgi:MFS family permease